MDPKKIVLLKALLDGHEGLVVVRTADPRAGIVQLLISPDFVDDVKQILNDIGRYIWMESYVCE